MHDGWCGVCVMSADSVRERLAKDVVVGDTVWISPEWSTTLVARRVVGVKEVVRYTPLTSVHTLAGPVIVDGVLASSYEWYVRGIGWRVVG